MNALSNSLIAVDVGNSAVKCGQYSKPIDRETPLSLEQLAANSVLQLPPTLQGFSPWLEQLPSHPHDWRISSVQRDIQKELRHQITNSRPNDQITQLTSDHFPIRCDVERPHTVGTDRLAAACAVNRVRDQTKPAIIIDAGTATTIDLVDCQGIYQGGVILPGPQITAAALSDHADLLPRVPFSQSSASTPMIGKNTHEAIESGLFWGTVGAIKQILNNYENNQSNTALIFLSGGNAPRLHSELRAATYVPHLVLAGISLSQIE
ncbi:MAG: type III pantothenate kinase [Planctomycetota bacterium]|nr:type III pantothenate kinase [Planctomycetota bacterium]